jgi:hypothetical protein
LANVSSKIGISQLLNRLFRYVFNTL